MKILTIIVRTVLGLAFVLFGVFPFLTFLPQPPPPPGLAGDYVRVFTASHYAQVVGAMQLLSGLMLVSGKFVPLGLTILGGILFNIWAFHILMDPGLKEMAGAIIATLLWAFIFWQHRERFTGILRP
jgi:hypothetical protein